MNDRSARHALVHRLREQLAPARDQIHQLEAEVRRTPESPALLGQAMDHLGALLEEIQAAQAEIDRQIDALEEVQASLETERQRNRQLFEHAPVVYLVTDAAGVIQDANRAAFEFFGIPERSFFGKPLALYVHPDHLRRFRIGLWKLVKDPFLPAEQTVEWEIRFCPRAAAAVDAAVSLSVLRDAYGKLNGILWLIRDRPEPKSGSAGERSAPCPPEAGLPPRTKGAGDAVGRQGAQMAPAPAVQGGSEAAQRRLAFVAEVSSVLGLPLDETAIAHRLVELAVPDLADAAAVLLAPSEAAALRSADQSASPAFPLLHWAAAQVAHDEGSAWAAQILKLAPPVPPENPPEPTGLGARLRAQQVVAVPHLTRASLVDLGFAPTADTLFRTLRTSALLLVPLVAHGDLLGLLLLLFADPARMTELGVEDLAAVVGQRAAAAIENARLYQAAEEAVHSRDQLLSAVSHDLKNPLGIIKGYAQLLRAQLAASPTLPSTRLTHGLSRIDNLTDRMTGQINELLDLTRQQRGHRLQLDRAETDLVALAVQLVDEYRETGTPQPIELVCNVPSIVGWWDAGRLQRALDNLVTNAVKFSDHDRPIRITLTTDCADSGSRVIITVQDQGVGIPAADLPYVFEPFHRARNTSGRIRGTGLGLASVRQVVVEHGGTVQVASTEHVGTTVTIILPLTATKSE